MLSHPLPETQLALALSIFFATFVYEDGATLLAATLSANGKLDPRMGLLCVFAGIWVGDMGLYGLGTSLERCSTQSRWLKKYLAPESVAKAEAWFAKHGSLALVMSRAIPGSRLPLYVAAGALRLPFRLFAKVTAMCSAVWVSAIFVVWRFVPKTLSGHQKLLPWLIGALVLFAPWVLGKIAVGVLHRFRWAGNRDRLDNREALGLCAP